MRRKLAILTPVLITILTLSLLAPTPVLAHPLFSTTVSIVGPVAPVPAGSLVTLIVRETNNGSNADPVNLYITAPWVSLEPGGHILDASNRFSVVGTGYGNPADAVLDYGETWEWHVNVTVNSNTLYTAIGHGFAAGDTAVDVTFPAVATEKSELWVYVTSPGQGRWTGGGTIDSGAIAPESVIGKRVTHGFEFHNDLDKPNNFEVNWGGNYFHMTELTWAYCWMNPELLQPNPPVAPVNEVWGIGTGKYNGVEGYIINFHLTDTGEPGGLNDIAEITITGPGPTFEVVLQVSGELIKGNQQAHRDNK
jgi:hypothetical protein